MIKLSYNEQRAYFSTGFKVRYTCATYMFQAIIKLCTLTFKVSRNSIDTAFDHFAIVQDYARKG